MPFAPREIVDVHTTTSSESSSTVPGPGWLCITEHDCSFKPEDFTFVVTNLIRNPNNTSSHLFRADILYDSQDGELENTEEPRRTAKQVEQETEGYSDLPGFSLQRTLVRKFVPRNPTLDKPIEQACLFHQGDTNQHESGVLLVIMRPYSSQPEHIPWYHPAVQAIAYRYSWTRSKLSDAIDATISVHYRLFPSQSLPLDVRLLRTARKLLLVAYKHGEGRLNGYVKKGQHDRLLAQKRVQDRYTELKQAHAKRLCDAWIEQTEPSKHVFEDLSIAAYLIELWREMYAAPGAPDGSDKPPFPGFVDIGCGNGVLTEVLILSGYPGRGFDARRRKTWAILSPQTQENLHEMYFVPQPLFDLQPAAIQPAPTSPPPSLRARMRQFMSSAGLSVSSTPSSTTTSGSSIQTTASTASTASSISTHPAALASELAPPSKPWHNGIFPAGTFIVSNHADELTPWTPLLACLSASPFLAIPCCSHNLSGARFRAPSAFNSNSADTSAPAYFDAQKTLARAKSVPISVPGYPAPGAVDDGCACGQVHGGANGAANSGADGNASHEASGQLSSHTRNCSTSSGGSYDYQEAWAYGSSQAAPNARAAGHGPERGSLKQLSPAARRKQPSAYASLCEWVTHLGRAAGFEVEHDMLRIPSTRNVGIVGRRLRIGGVESSDAVGSNCRNGRNGGDGGGDDDARVEGDDESTDAADAGGVLVCDLAHGATAAGVATARGVVGGEPSSAAQDDRWERVMQLVRREGADGKTWVARCQGVLAKAADGVHV